jgi:hypothetical protein
MSKKKPTRVVNDTGPLAGAKVGSWLITNRGDLRQITRIGDFGIKCGRYVFSLSGKATHTKYLLVARFATPEEIANYLRELAEDRERAVRELAEERRRERVRDAAEQLLAACKAVLTLLPQGEYPSGAGAGSEAVRIRDMIRGAIAAAGEQST